MKAIFISLFLTIFIPIISSASLDIRVRTFTGQVRDLAEDRPIFSFKSVGTQEGKKYNFVNTYKNNSEKIAVQEDLAVDLDRQILDYIVTQNQINEIGVVKVRKCEAADPQKLCYKDRLVEIRKKIKGKDDKVKLDKYSDNFVVAPTLSTYLISPKQWNQLIAGKTVKVRFGVWNKLMVIGFDFTKVKEETINGRKAIKIVMKPSNWLFKKLVDDLYFDFDLKTKNVISFTGRVLPKANINGKWKDLDAITNYTY